MKRRDFIKSAVAAGVLAGASMKAGALLAKNSSGNPVPPAEGYDLVAIKGGDPATMFDRAIGEMGGMKAFITKGQKVLVKPNIGWDVAPELAANTNPLLVKRIVEQCLAAGAKEVYVFDNTCDDWEKCYTNSGIEKAVRDAGGKMAPGNSEKYYHEVGIIKGTKLKKAKVHELVLNSDVFINVPILKDHGSSKTTITMKNLMGIVWDRYYWHRTGLHQCIADFASYSKPTLNVVDAYRVMTKRGPRGVSADDVSVLKTLLISRDMVAADAAATKLLGLKPEDIKYIQTAAGMGTGSIDLDKLSIKRIIL